MRLARVNPAVKALTIVLCVLVLALFFDPWTPFLFMLWTLATAALFGGIPWKKWAVFLPPFVLFAFGYFWTVLLFADPAAAGDVRWSWGGLEITREAFNKGLSLGLRVLAFASLSFLFIFTTDPVRFIYALMRQCKLPPKLAYGILAGFRFLPALADELALIRKAHRIRGVDRTRGVGERIRRIGRILIPLLAGAIRKAERAAMAMESKGFTGSRDRTYYYEMNITGKDWWFPAIMLAGLAGSIAVSWKLGALDTYRILL